MPFSIFRLQTLMAANVAGFIMGTALFSMFLILTLYMQQVLGLSALKTGVGYLAVAGTAVIWANGGSRRHTDRGEARAHLRHELADPRPSVLHAGLR